MSSERQRGESCGSQSAGKLFQTTGPATAKLLVPREVVVLGTDSNPVRAYRTCLLPLTSFYVKEVVERETGEIQKF